MDLKCKRQNFLLPKHFEIQYEVGFLVMLFEWINKTGQTKKNIFFGEPKKIREISDDSFFVIEYMRIKKLPKRQCDSLRCFPSRSTNSNKSEIRKAKY